MPLLYTCENQQKNEIWLVLSIRFYRRGNMAPFKQEACLHLQHNRGLSNIYSWHCTIIFSLRFHNSYSSCLFKIRMIQSESLFGLLEYPTKATDAPLHSMSLELLQIQFKTLRRYWCSPLTTMEMKTFSHWPIQNQSSLLISTFLPNTPYTLPILMKERHTLSQIGLVLKI